MTRAFGKRVKTQEVSKRRPNLEGPPGIDQRPYRKFRPNWSGPYVIQDLTQEGTTWLTDLDDNQFTEPVNVDQLKRFYA